ncbi:MAG: NTP transferase domain-containing protein [Bacteroidales bacterium]|nr:NTP transferase domain-containing protein [Bacteroidales bacterium]
MEKEKVTGIVLAGGKSRRMGSEKGMVLFRGKPMIEYAVEALAKVCDQILISANSSVYHYLGLEIVKDEIPDSGPMGGIYSCLKKSKNEVNFVLSCDMPLISGNVISHILKQIDGSEIAVPWNGETHYEPLCAAYKTGLLREFELFIQSGNFKIIDLIEKVNTKKITTGFQGLLKAEYFSNINSMKDLETLVQKESTEKLEYIPNLLMIAGTGRNVGKTSFACQLIAAFSKDHEVVGIKISPHIHEQADGQKVIAGNNSYQIIEETNPDSAKDSSRMLLAGASRVYFLQTIDKNIREPFGELLALIPKNQPVVCESGALLNYARPGVFIVIKRSGGSAIKEGIDKLAYAPDGWVQFNGEDFDTGVEAFAFSDEGWKKIKSPNP